jgi:hypothetical protein
MQSKMKLAVITPPPQILATLPLATNCRCTKPRIYFVLTSYFPQALARLRLKAIFTRALLSPNLLRPISPTCALSGSLLHDFFYMIYFETRKVSRFSNIRPDRSYQPPSCLLPFSNIRPERSYQPPNCHLPIPCEPSY